jgi:hypothetical protein
MKNFTILKSNILILFSMICFLLTNPLLGQKTKIAQNLKDLSKPQQLAKKQQVSPKLVPYSGLIQKKGNYVLVEAIPKTDCATLAAKLEDLGLQKTSIFGGKVQGYLPVSAISSLEGIAELAFIAPTCRPRTNSGITTTQGDFALHSFNVRDTYGVNGAGVKIGVLSDSYNSLMGADTGVISGDLPGLNNPDGFTTPVEVLSDITDGTDEGRAMIEIIHDMAPGATLAFNTANTGDAAFAQGILDLAADGCNIITDDVSYLSEPFFQDGIIAQAVDMAVKNYGVSHYSSAGNQGRESYESAFRNGGHHLVINSYSGDTLGRYMLHDFDPGPGVDNYQQVTLDPGGLLLYTLQWDDPFASVCETCPGAKTDVDIFLTLEKNPESVVLQSINSNVGADPYEILGVLNNDTVPLTAYIAIGKWLDAEGPNPNPGIIKYINFGDNSIDNYVTSSSTSFGHHNAEKVTSVGASYWFRTPWYNVNPPKINYYSTVGGTPILFNTKGKRLRNPSIRQNPDFVATDGGNTSFFGQLLNDGDKFPNFFGTSAAAPHAAAVAALLTQMSDKKVSQQFITNCMAKSAIDMDDPFTSTFDKGYDYASGYGLIQADAAAVELLKNIGIKPISVTAMCSQIPDSFRNWSVYNPNAFNVSIEYGNLLGDITQSLILKPGNNLLSTPTQSKCNVLNISWTDAWGNVKNNAAYSRGTKCKPTKSGVESEDADVPFILVSKAYPNPVTDHLKVELFASDNETILLNLYDVNGRVVYSTNYEANGYALLDIPTANLPRGMYYVKVTKKNGEVIKSAAIVKK